MLLLELQVRERLLSEISLSEKHLVKRKGTKTNNLVFSRYLPILFTFEKMSVNST